ncbi:hypothetical protein [Aeoliella sp.]|uniref:hypothetical protein n=1 Tax=Aeoliella sp. TaxID=2795800 RepID=UPI003CCC4061
MLRILFTCLLLCPIARADEPKGPNDDVLEIAYEYEDGGHYKWKGSGVPEELRFGGEQILPKGDGTYCCGYTLAVVFKAAEQRGLLEKKTVDDVRKLHKMWYGDTDDSKETLVQHALKELKLGKSVEHEDAQPGDFVQFWRTNKSGHSVIFLEWIVDEGARIGVKYRSSQKSTDGIGDRIEYFSDVDNQDGKLDRKRFYIVRLNKPE